MRILPVCYLIPRSTGHFIALLAFLCFPCSAGAQQAGTIGSTTVTSTTRQLVTMDTTTTVNNLSQSVVVSGSGMTATSASFPLLETTTQDYILSTPNGNLSTSLRSTALNPALNFQPISPGAEFQLSVTSEMPGIKSVSKSTSTSDTVSNSTSFSLFSNPMNP